MYLVNWKGFLPVDKVNLPRQLEETLPASSAGVVVKNVKIKKFFPFFFLYIFSSYYHPISLRNYTIRLNNWTLRINSPWSPQRRHWNTPGSTITPRWTTYHKDFTKPNYNPQATQTPPVQYTLIYIHLHSLHFTSTYYIIPAA
jgi:hypothetical protein